uniref:pentatricopeptide repeat-containing protein At1g80550, mitochondrial n=1 Tax=Erigeron canadensis TaxID=72917 RepID=UPI001CB97731|nr:pentatricopeptide repeat-containing protein At1g80550, mitochondrial [Erigeron canadensis]XP_043619189.1 pentatricopeptide repeat-containing protein At1g80550, mitochondrial [Erigeron canadensis]XP_043619190.1 pentatricopeptide repeat-containing protein At1g80550, mitochondrial [Erigeron canadensis]XP_043619191.1 pentatricopeptide repeat-containing protein At1g80550, mitochondrial [Erigeron canadensis]XP_043619192.1 pentatricopeptide repeat-containing protein At1g80550, mitochondrial [Eriger
MLLIRRSTSIISKIRPSFTLYHFHTLQSKTPTNPTSFPGHQAPKNSNFDQPIVNQATVLETLTCYNNDWKRAIDFFNWVESEYGFKHTIDTYNHMIDILGKFFEFELAHQLFDKMPERDHATIRVMFKRYASAHLVHEAIGVFEKLGEVGMNDETSFLNLVDALCEYKHVIEAEALCLGSEKEKILGFEIGTKVYNMILRGWLKMGWWGKCREFWEQMDEDGIAKDLYSYSIYMDIQCKSGKPWKAVKLYKEMKKKGIKLDVVAYNTVMRAVGVSEGVDVAVHLGREMLELGCEPNVVTYNTIIKLLCENGRVREAYKVLDKMWKRGCAPNVITYHCIFRCLDKPNEILALLDRMIESGVSPSMDTYVLLIKKFGRWGFLRPVFIVWGKMEDHGLSPNEFAYNALIDALVDKGMVDMARKYDEEMLAKGLSAKLRPELVKGECDDG